MDIKHEHKKFIELVEAATNGDISIVTALLEEGIVNPLGCDSLPLREAAKGGHAACVEKLIPVSKPTAEYNYAIGWAAANGHHECVELLIPHSDFSICSGEVLEAAVRSRVDSDKRIRCVELLAPHNDSRANNKALWWAAALGATDVIDALLPHSDPEKAITEFVRDGDTELAAMIRARQEHCEISSALNAELMVDQSQPRKARRM